MAVDKAKRKKTTRSKDKARTSSRRAKDSQVILDLKNRADRALRAHNVEQAEHAYSQALELGRQRKEGLEPALEYDLLSGRATCYEYLGAVAAEIDDLDEMADLADGMGDLSRRIDVVDRQTEPWSQIGKSGQMLEVAIEVESRARKSGDKQQRADGLLALGHAYSQIEDLTESLRAFEKALELFQELGDQRGEAECIYQIGSVDAYQGRPEAAREKFTRALTLQRAFGDRKKEARILSALSIFTVDQAAKRDLGESSLSISIEINDSVGQSREFNNLSLLYGHLGLYDTGLGLIDKAVESARARGAAYHLATYLESRARILFELGKIEDAGQAFQEVVSISNDLNSRYLRSYGALGLGQVALAMGRPKVALDHFEDAFRNFKDLNAAVETATAMAFIGSARLALGHQRLAQKATAEAVDLFGAAGDASGDYPPQLIGWSRYKVLEAVLATGKGKKSKPRAAGPSKVSAGTIDDAWQAIQRAHDLTLEGIANLSDQGLRRNYLNKVKLNREILGAWAREAIERGMALDVESPGSGNLQAQLKRMLAIGLKLNDRRDTEQLTAFIMEQFIELSGAERSALILTGDDGERHVAAQRHFSNSDPKAVLQLAASMLEEVTATAHSAVRQDVSPADLLDSSAEPMDVVSAVCIPLIAHERLLGMLYGDIHVIFGPFGEADIDLLSAFANQAAAAIENARLYQGLEDRVTERTTELHQANLNLEQRAAELAVINSVQEGLASKLDFQAIIELVGEKIMQVFDQQGIGIRIYDPETDLVHYPFEVENKTRLPAYPPRKAMGLSRHIIRTRQPLTLNEDLDGWLEEHGALLLPGSQRNKSVLGVPVIVKDQVRGLVVLEDSRENAYSPADERLLSTIAASMGVALENARLFDETTRLLEETRQRNAELAVINSVQEGLASQLDIQAIFELVGEKVREIFDAQAIDIMTYDRSTNLCEYRFGFEKGKRLQPGEVPPFPPGGFSGHMLKTRQPLMFNEDLLARAEEYGSVPHAGEMSKSYLGVPLIRGDAAVGVISLQHIDKENAYTDSDLRLLMTLASSMSVALENARLFDETTQLLEETRRRNAELAVINKVQDGLASKLDLAGIVEVVGEEIARILESENVHIGLLSDDGQTIITPFYMEHGDRFPTEPMPLERARFTSQVFETRKPLVVDLATQLKVLEEGGGVHGDPDSPFPKSHLFVPILSGDKPVGVISVADRDREDAFGESEISLVTTLANSMSVALENARLFEETNRLLDETKQRAAELSIINSVQQGLAAQLDLDGIIELVGDKILEIVDSDTVGIGLLDRNAEVIRVPYLYDQGKRHTGEIPLGKGLASHVILGKKTLLINEDMERRAEELGAVYLGSEEIDKSWLGVPIVVGEKAVGAISVSSMTEENAFSSSDVRLVETLASSMGVALENARLFEETNRLLDETQQRAAELSIINSVGQGLVKQLEYQAIVDLVGDKVGEIFSADTTYIALVDPQTGTGHMSYYVDRGARKLFDPVRSYKPSGLTGHILESMKPLLLGSGEEGRQYGVQRVSSEEDGVDRNESFLGVPLFRGSQAVGVVSVQSYQQNAFDESDLRLLTTLTSSMSVALENARLFEETNRLLDETRQRNAEMGVINSIQQGLASKLDMQAIFDLVGDKIRQIFDAQGLAIFTYDRQLDLVTYRYIVERGERIRVEPMTPGGFGAVLLKEHKPLLFNENIANHMMDYGSIVIAGELSKSYLGVPLVIGDQAIGGISLENIDRENAFSEADVRLLGTIASSMSVALENARLFAETRRLLDESQQHNIELAAISTVSQALVAENDLNRILEMVGEQVREIFDADVAYVALHDTNTNLITFPYLHGEEDVRSMPFGSGLTSEIIRSGKHLLLNRDLDAAAAELKTERTGTKAASYLGVPIFVGGQTIGVLSVQSTTQEDRFDEADVRLLTTIAANAGAAIGSAKLYEETKQRASELAAINVIGEGLLSQMDMDRVVELVGESISQIFDTEQIGIAICDYEAQKIRLPYVVINGERYPQSDMDMGEGLASVVIKTRQPLRLNNWEELRQHGAVVHPNFKDPLPEENSWLGVPIMSGTEVSGVIFSNGNRANAFSEADQRLLSTIAANMGVAIRNAQLHGETQRRAEEMQALNEIGREASATLDLPTVLARITSNARRVLAANTTAVVLLENDGVSLRPISSDGQMAEEVKAFTWKLGEGLVGSIVEGGNAERVNDVTSDPRAIELPGTGETIKGEKMLVAPLISRQRPIGAIAAWRGADEDVFTQEDLNFTAGLAQQATIAIENARLFEEAQRRALQMAALNELGREISATLDLTDVLNRITAKSRELLAGDTSAVFMLEADGSTLRVISADGRIADQVKAMTAVLGEGMVGSIAKAGVAEVINDVSRDPRGIHIPGTSDAIENEKLMAAPLMTKDKVLGVMAIWRNETGPIFTDADLAFLASLARQATVAIENARLFDETERQRDYSRDLVENSPVAIITTDLNGKVASWNPAAERLFAYSAEEAIGHSLDQLIATESLRDEALDFTKKAWDEGRVNAVTRRARKDGSEVDVELLALPVSVDGAHSGLIAIYHDITELLKAQREAESANEAKSAFLATMSHEIRTPMNAVIGMSGLLLDTQLDPEQHEFAEIIRNSGDALLGIINDVLDFSKIEAGKMELEYQPFDLRECIEGTLDLVATRAFDKGLDLAYVIDDGVPAGIVGDVTRLRQILLNLLTNAVKFTERGEVVLKVGQDEGAVPTTEESQAMPGDQVLNFTVRDTGIGIPVERMDRLFQSFSQVDASTARKYGGTGLGLAISKRLSEMMGGTMWVESQQDVGTTFHFTIQTEPSEAITAASRRIEHADQVLNGRRVLIVDDNDTNRRILTAQVKGWGMIPRDSASPRQALKWIQKGDPLDIAILDMHMPEMDGLMLASEIRQDRAADALPLILFTSLGRRETGADELGFAAFLTKPIKPSQLYDALVGIFAGKPVAARRPPSQPQKLDPEMAKRHPLRILLAEDNAVNQKLAIRLLAQMGYRADVAANGLEAVESLERQRYDLVLMDVQMPEMDGLEASRQINKQWPRGQRPQIVAMTANAMQGDRELCIAAGMDDYITKPIRVEELVAALDRVPAGRSQEEHDGPHD